MTTRASRQVFLDGLRAFSVAARQLSFKAAADALYVTPSAVSHRIRDLEKHLGQRLFVRKIRAIELTDRAAHCWRTSSHSWPRSTASWSAPIIARRVGF